MVRQKGVQYSHTGERDTSLSTQQAQTRYTLPTMQQPLHLLGHGSYFEPKSATTAVQVDYKPESMDLALTTIFSALDVSITDNSSTHIRKAGSFASTQPACLGINMEESPSGLT